MRMTLSLRAIPYLLRIPHVHFHRVCREHDDVLSLIQKQHEAQVTHSLLCKPRRGNELQTLHLTPVGRVVEHVHEQQLGHIAMPELVGVVLESTTDVSCFFLDDGTLLGSSLAGTDSPNELAELDRHGAVLCKGPRRRRLASAVCTLQRGSRKNRRTS